jgi:hypothetical protein
VAGALLVSGTALAQTPPDTAKQVIEPIRVDIECQTTGRTKTCPSFLWAIIEANPVLMRAPRSDADVIVYVNVAEVANEDRVQLRFVGRVPKAPSVIEVEAPVDSRATDDAQRAQIEPAFLRGIALYVGARHPEAVRLTLVAPAGSEPKKAQGTPWGASLSVNANGSYTDKYRSAGGEAVTQIQYVTRNFRFGQFTFWDGSINRQPPLMLDDGTIASLDSNAWDIRGGAEAAYSLNDEWVVGIGSYHAISDRKAQNRFDSRSRLALGYNFFAPDDPRGNKLELFYHLGWQLDKYNLPNDLHESFAQYPVTGIDASGSVRHDKISYGINLETDVQANHPSRRYSITAAPFVSFQIGAHVDLSLNYSITKRELPPPDPDAIDPSDYAQLSRLSFAEPLSMSGSVSLTIHFDPTNGARNNRLTSI